MKRSLSLAACLAALCAVLAFLNVVYWKRSSPPRLHDSIRGLDFAGHPDAGTMPRFHAHIQAEESGNCDICHFPDSSASKRALWTGSAGRVDFMASANAIAPVNTQLCVSCHDGSTASLANYASGGAAGGSLSPRANPDLGHPVGIRYADALSRRPSHYRPAAGNPDIHLDNGTVGCVSCHDMHNLTGYANNVRPRTCKACHRY